VVTSLSLFLKVDDYFGEISFFTELPRSASVKARDFTNVVYLDRDIYLDTAENDESNEQAIVNIIFL